MLVIFDEFLKLNSNAGNKRFQRELLLGKHGTIIIDVKGDYFDGKSINIILSKLYFIIELLFLDFLYFLLLIKYF